MQREVTNQWIMDSNEFVLSRRPPFADMFEEWNLGQQSVEGNVVAEPPWWEKYDLPLLPGGPVPRGGGLPAVPLASVATYEGDGIWRVKSRANDWMRQSRKVRAEGPAHPDTMSTILDTSRPCLISFTSCQLHQSLSWIRHSKRKAPGFNC